VVALLATLLAAPGVGLDQPADPDQPTKAGQAKAKPQAEAAAGDDQPALIRAGAKVVRAGAKVVRGVSGAVRWLVDLWRQASQKAAPANGEAMAAPLPSLSPTAPSIWRFGS
jgi:hypothetical protein